MITLISILQALTVSGLTTFLLIPLTKNVSRNIGCMGIDVHKTPSYPVPKLGGISIIAGTMAGFGVITLYIDSQALSAAFYISTLIAALIGLFEDFHELNPVLKPLMLTAAGIPVVLLGVYTPNPFIPFIGHTRLTIIYPLLVLAGFAVVCNAVNSIDVLNGSMAFTSLAAMIPLAVTAYLENKMEAFSISLVAGFSLIVFLTQNKYPAKIFAGNVGSLYVGAVLTFIAITGRLEVVAIVALMPQIMNEFHIIYSLRGFKNAKRSAFRPVLVNANVIKANMDERAPITLLRMLTVGPGLTEKQAVTRMTLLSLYSALLSIITYFLFIKGV